MKEYEVGDMFVTDLGSEYMVCSVDVALYNLIDVKYGSRFFDYALDLYMIRKLLEEAIETGYLKEKK
jgi:hypothetical protein